MILANVTEADKAGINALLVAARRENGKPGERAARRRRWPARRCRPAASRSRNLNACCPALIDRIEKLCAEVGLAGEEIIIRSTGCPNGCARPYMAEIAFVGKAPGRYQVWLGGDAAGTRLNRVWKDVIKEADIETEFRPVLARFAKERNSGERFGDWCDRVFLKEQPAAPN